MIINRCRTVLFVARQMETNNLQPKQTKRQEWINRRASELIASGWRSQALALKRAAKEWRKASPQHQAAVKRNSAMAQARADRLNSLPASDVFARQ